MTTTTYILLFAQMNKQFTCKELFAYLSRQQPSILSKSVFQQLGRLVKSKRLMRIERGIYVLPATSQKLFRVVVSDELKQLSQQFKIQFPFVNYCMWSGNAIIPSMHHIPDLNYTYVDVERDATESVFNFLSNNSSKRVFLCPNKEDFNRYINGTETIIVRILVSEAPLQVVDKVNTPTIEKILVDIVGDVEFDFMQGAEISYFYKNVIESYTINNNKLLRYASRRGRRAQVEQLLNNAL